jgi:hypothetical protein
MFFLVSYNKYSTEIALGKIDFIRFVFTFAINDKKVCKNDKKVYKSCKNDKKMCKNDKKCKNLAKMIKYKKFV